MQGKKNNTKKRPFTKDTGFLICLWHSRGESEIQIAKDLQRDVNVIKNYIKQAKADGRYDKYVEYHQNYLETCFTNNESEVLYE